MFFLCDDGLLLRGQEHWQSGDWNWDGFGDGHNFLTSCAGKNNTLM